MGLLVLLCTLIVVVSEVFEAFSDLIGLELNEVLHGGLLHVELEVVELLFGHALALALGTRELLHVVSGRDDVEPVRLGVVEALLEQDAIGFFDHLLVLPVLLDVDDGVGVRLDLLRQLFLLLVPGAVERLQLGDYLGPAFPVALLAPRLHLLKLNIPPSARR